VFIVHLGGALAAFVPLLIYGGGRIGGWRNVPWYTLGAGVFGLVVIGALSYMIPRVGIAVSITTLIAGQLLIGTALDHFGLLGVVQRSFDFTRAIGLTVVFIGAWLTVR